MSDLAEVGARESLGGSQIKRKRLGQYFSGLKIGRLLAAICHASAAKTIMDPMAGSGDLLAACLEMGARPEVMGAIEIDPIAIDECGRRMPETVRILGNAFDPSTLNRAPIREWDLVIANPPYVRYQSLAGGDFELPSAADVRRGLLESLEGMTALDDDDRRLFRILVKSYSGLSDLAVPAWILAASMVAVGGRLALVVPESWLSRDYASVVQYMLLRWFRIEKIVEDEHAGWFSDAQVKTTLLVAKRVPRRDSAFSWGLEEYARAKVSGRAAGQLSLVQKIYIGKKCPESLFAKDCDFALSESRQMKTELSSIAPLRIASFADSLRSVFQEERWGPAVGELINADAPDVYVGDHLSEWIGKSYARGLVALGSIGVGIGQGLRTGANEFFYLSHVRVTQDGEVVRTHDLMGKKEIVLPSDVLFPVVRKQADLPEGYTIRAKSLGARLLYIQEFALASDIKGAGALARKTYQPAGPALAALIRQAEKISFGKSGGKRPIKELTAVAPNIRGGNEIKGVPPRFWYMLPRLADRHLPQVIVPRVNSGSVRAFLIGDKNIVVDANFSSLSVPAKCVASRYAILALLNSSWCQAALEEMAAKMGGGALKVESTHLRRLPIPLLSGPEWVRLSALGLELAKGNDSIQEINHLVASAVLGRSCGDAKLKALKQLVEGARIRRGLHNKKWSLR